MNFLDSIEQGAARYSHLNEVLADLTAINQRDAQISNQKEQLSEQRERNNLERKRLEIEQRRLQLVEEEHRMRQIQVAALRQMRQLLVDASMRLNELARQHSLS